MAPPAAAPAGARAPAPALRSSAMDPTAPAGPQPGAADLLQRHGPALADEAKTILRRHPDADLAGLIATADAQQAAPLRALLAQCCSEPLANGLLIGLVPRELLVAALARQLPARGAPTANARQQLPVIVATRTDLRIALLPCATVR